jgi:hypothetical protein
VLGLLSASLVAAAPRQVVRDFPVSYCPVHLGKPVGLDPEGNPILLLDSPTRVRPELSFTATGTVMMVTLSTCSAGTVLQPEVEIGLDNFAVIRSSGFIANQVRYPFTADGCYFRSGTPAYSSAVGTRVDPSVRPGCGPLNPSCPFGDDFERPTCRWSLDGPARIDHELVFPPSAACSTATIRIDHLVPGESYVVDYDWRADHMSSPGQPLLTVDIAPPPPSIPPVRPAEMTRDLPSSYCPVHLGGVVGGDGTGVDFLTFLDPKRVRPELTFTATGPKMEVTLSTCSGAGTMLQLGEEIGFDNFAIVRCSAFLEGQYPRAYGPFDPQDCYYRSGTPNYSLTVGTRYVNSYACGPSNPDCPFSDDFTDPAGSAQQWSLGGRALFYDSRLLFPSSAECSKAAVTIDNLVPGESYVVDYDWNAYFVQNDAPLLAVDIAPPPTKFFTLPPCRPIDTRGAVGAYGGPALSANADRTFTLAGQCGIPPTARAVAVNVTVTQPDSRGYLLLYPAGTAPPTVSAINYSAGQTRANNAIVSLDAAGAINVRCGQAAGSVHFILDVTGYFE